VLTVSNECVVCWKCIDSCPEKAIRENEKKLTAKYIIPVVEIDNDACSECGICKEICPVDAIQETDSTVAAWGEAIV